MQHWDLSCLDWEARLREGRSLVPELPLIASEADLGVRFFDEMQLPDVPEKPFLRDAAGQWFRDIVRAAFGSWDPVAKHRYIRDIFALAPKGSSKTSYSAGLMLAAMLMNRRPRAEALFVGPTQAVSDRAYEQAAGMIEASRDLQRRFKARDHNKTIEDLQNGSEMKVKTFDVSILTGSILIFVLLDELHLLGRNAHTTKVLRQIRGGLDKTPEGLLLITTTQSDEIPTGAFKDELVMARKMRDGGFRGQEVRPMLPVLYEYPLHLQQDEAFWSNPANWHMVMPNLGRSVHLSTLGPDWAAECQKGEHARRVWTSQHLNIEIGIGLLSGNWPGAEFWERQADPSITLDYLLEVCDVIVVGLDGGGLDDLYGVAVMGRHRDTRQWLVWLRAWCHEIVLDRRPKIVSKLRDFQVAEELTIVSDDLGDVVDIVALIQRVKDAGLLGSVCVDPAGLGEMVEALAEIEITLENGLLLGVPQGFALMNSIKTCERKLANRTLRHSGSALGAWCVGNLKIEPTATAIRATKQTAGDAKIDPAMAMFNCAFGMMRNPEPRGGSIYDDEAAYNEAFGRGGDIDGITPDAWSPAILADPGHPDHAKHLAAFHDWQDLQGD